MNKIKVVMEGHGRGKVWLDGNEIKNLRSVNIQCEAGDIN